MGRLIDADALEREGWSLCRNYQQDKKTMVYESKSIVEIPTAQPDVPDKSVGDMISRQAAINALDGGAELIRRVLDNMELVGGERSKFAWGLGLFESCIYELNELPSAQPEQRWIPCSERLPEEMTYVLVTDKDGDVYSVKFIEVIDGQAEWVFDNGIIAWMPLPEPYDPLAGHMNPPEDET